LRLRRVHRGRYRSRRVQLYPDSPFPPQTPFSRPPV
jgi:hypothetical protein